MLNSLVGEAGYQTLLAYVLEHGKPKSVYGTTDLFVHSILGGQLRFDLSNGQIPIFTTKKVIWEKAFAELLWHINGDTNCQYLQDQNVDIWDKYAYNQVKHLYSNFEDWQKNALFQDKETASPYGPALRNFQRNQIGREAGEVDQLAMLINRIRNEPNRKHNWISLYDPRYSYEAAPKGESFSIAPCVIALHAVVNNGKLGFHVIQRSVDMALGLVWDIAQYAMLAHVLGKITGLEIDEMVWTGSDCHVYSNQIEAIKKMLERTPGKQPLLVMNDNITEENLLAGKVTPQDFQVLGYNPDSFIKVPYHIAGGKNLNGTRNQPR